MKHILQYYNEKAAESIVSAYSNNLGRACLTWPVGTGSYLPILNSLAQIVESNPNVKVLFLFPTKILVEEYPQRIKNFPYDFSNSFQNFTFETYSSFVNNTEKINLEYDIVFCISAEILDATYEKISLIKSKLCLAIFNNRNQNINNIFFGYPYVFENPGVSFITSESNFINCVFVPLLENLKFTIKDKKYPKNNKILSPDIVATKNSVTHFFEVKFYKSLHVDSYILNNAIENFIDLKKSKNNEIVRFTIVFLCLVDEQLKIDMMTKYRIMIWDIKNILYLSRNSKQILYLLEKHTPYSINQIESVEPLSNKENDTKNLITTTISSQPLIDRLTKCKPGKTENAHIEFENICSEIIQHLFETEFSQFSGQHTTNDELFRMDMICGLKGTAEFWKFLLKYYNSKFVIFECKNYSEQISQNLIYITEKYLFSTALRNVAFIISRKGFSENSKSVAIAILREHNKLIIDLTDEDLIFMLKMKESGNEPSDYLLDKVEKFLMSISI